MTKVIYPQDEGEDVVVNLRDPFWSALLAWLVPGAGHLYQRRIPKACLFAVCILTTYFAGLALGEGRVVYASWKPGDYRWQYACQLGVGLPAIPAMVQSMRVKDGSDPYFILCERHPVNSPRAFMRIEEGDQVLQGARTFKDGLMAPPAGPHSVNERDVLGMWHYELKHFFEIGTLFTVVAGLLNLLAVYDAFSGPAIMTPEEREEMEKKKGSR